jgi:muramoyltetrapeptide carboxypeptidase
MICPSPLQPGDKIALISVAGKISRETVEKAIVLLEEEGFVTQMGAHAFDVLNAYAGTDQDRASDMQKALDDPEVRAILFTRGGYGSLRTFMLLDWTEFHRHPKWLIGFSDITVFHSYLSLKGVVSVHGVMTSYFFENGVRTSSLDKLLEVLRGKSPEYDLPPNPLNIPGTCQGELTGGNLSILYSLRGTSLDVSLAGKVLFLEDIQEFDYHLDRMMMNLKFGGVLSSLAGLIVGYFTETKSGETPYGQDAFEIIREAVSGYSYPVVFGFPAGHELPDYPLLMGAEIRMEVTGEKVIIKQPSPGGKNA